MDLFQKEFEEALKLPSFDKINKEEFRCLTPKEETLFSQNSPSWKKIETQTICKGNKQTK